MKKTYNALRIVTITLFLLILCAKHAQAFDLDMTVEDDIRKNYNSSQLVKDTNTEDIDELPVLPEKLKKENRKEVSAVKKTAPKSVPSVQVHYKGNIKISKGTSFDVVSIGKISDWQTKGTVVKFKTNASVYKKKYSIPASTVFTGEIIESHQPQVSCNGGLVVIRIRSMAYKGQTVPVNAYVTRANDKLIFLNNIKGERTYMKTLWKKGNWGRSLFNRMLTLTINLGGDGSTILLSPFPFLYGTLCLGANTLVSPITAFCNRGKHVSIPTGSHFRIKLLEDAYID